MKIRKGNDIDIYWEIVTGDSDIPYDLTGKDLKLFLINTYEKVAIKDFEVDGNTIIWRYLGKDQQRSDIYSLLLIENEGKEDMHTVDECSAFELVNHSCMEEGDMESHVHIETLRLKSGVSVNSIVPDKELDVNSGNVVENAAIAKEIQRIDVDMEEMQTDIGSYGRDLDALGKVVAEHSSDISALIKNKAEQSAVDDLREVVDGKAEQIGTYPDMSVGLAEDLGGRPFFDEAEFNFRASAGEDTSIKDGLAQIKELRGNSVVWNQLRGNARGVSDDSKDGLTILTSPDSPYISIVGTPTHDDIVAYNGGMFPTINGIEGHKYAGVIKGNTHVSLVVYGGGDLSIGTGGIFTCASASALYLVPQIKNKVGVSINEEVILLCYDLTLMFGAGNEPTTIEDFYARMPIGVDEYAYNEGEVIHFNGDAIKSIGDNAYNKDRAIRGNVDDNTGEFEAGDIYSTVVDFMECLPNTQYFFNAVIAYSRRACVHYYDADMAYIGHDGVAGISNSDYTASGVLTTPNNARYMRVGAYTDSFETCMVTLVHSGWKVDTDAGYQPYWEDSLIFDQRIKEAFPNGMGKWDKVYDKNGKGYIVKGTGVADMGTLNWYYDTSLGGFYSDILVGAKKFFDGICAKYPFAGDYRNVTDKTCGFVYEGYVLVKDSSYTDAASLKESLQGVPLYYQLAEPTIIEYDEPFNLDYKVADFGTEEIIADTPSAPVIATIQYDFNANDTIRTNRLTTIDNSKKIRSLEERIAQLEAMITATTTDKTEG